MIFRQTELTKLRENIQKGQPTLLTGDVGIGKSHILREAQLNLNKAIYVESISPIKSALLSILKALHANNDLNGNTPFGISTQKVLSLSNSCNLSLALCNFCACSS